MTSAPPSLSLSLLSNAIRKGFIYIIASSSIANVGADQINDSWKPSRYIFALLASDTIDAYEVDDIIYVASGGTMCPPGLDECIYLRAGFIMIT